MFIPDPGSVFFPSRIRICFQCGSRIRIKVFKYFIPKKWLLSTQIYDPVCSSRIRILFSYPSRVPDPGVKQNGTRSGSATLIFWIFFQEDASLTVSLDDIVAKEECEEEIPTAQQLWLGDDDTSSPPQLPAADSSGLQQLGLRRKTRSCKRSNCLFCNRPPCGVCGPCRNPASKSRCRSR
jgi:hypothetical protein